MSNYLFVMFMLSISGFYFIVAGVIYWSPYYLSNVFMVPKDTADIFFLFITLSSPMSGVITGGFAISFYFGGLHTKNSIFLLMIVGIILISIILPMPFCTRLEDFGVLLWFLLFFGGFMMAPLVGLMLNTVEEEQRGSANSVAMFFFNALGWMPSPLIYGLVSQFVDKPEDKIKSRIPMMSILYSIFITLIIMFLALTYKLKQIE